MALNPAFQSQNTRRLPLAYGFVLGSGDQVLSTVQTNLTTVATAVAYLLGEGEWDGVEMIQFGQGSEFGKAMRKHAFSDPPGDIAYTFGSVFSGAAMHFHSGAWTPKGSGVTQIPVSVGDDQYIDSAFTIFPSVTPAQSFSGTAYAVFSATSPISINSAQAVVPTFDIVAVFRAGRCRTFDAAGNVTGYGFTLNPTWHFVDAVLRYKIKPQTPAIAGLAPAERACFNWPSVVAHAARNAFVLPNGNPRFVGSYIFAADATLTNILETILRCCRSYHFVRNGQIYLQGDDARSATFAMTAKHHVSGSLKLDKKDVSKSPNVFIPKYRDLAPPAVCQVSTVAPSTVNAGTMLFHSVTASPFLAGDCVVYGGGTNGASNGEYIVIEPANNEVGSPGDPSTVGLAYIPNVTAVTCGSYGSTSGGGYLGTNVARFSQRAPTNAQHRSHQKMMPAQAPGLSAQPKVVPVFYDCGNSTFDQTNRLMKFERDFQLGTDIGAGWTAPIAGTLTAYYEAVDANGKRLSDVNPRDVISIDDWLSPEFAGLYVVMDPIVVNPPYGDSVGTLELTLHAYNPNAFTDVSDPPGDTYATVPSPNLSLFDPPGLVNACWVLAFNQTYTTTGSGSSETITITMTDLVIHLMGFVYPTTYASATWAGLSVGQFYILYIDDPTGTGTTFTPGFQEGTGLAEPGTAVLNVDPPGRYTVFAGTITVPAFRLG